MYQMLVKLVSHINEKL